MADNDERETEEKTSEAITSSENSSKNSKIQDAKNTLLKASELSANLSSASNSANEFSSQVSGLSDSVSSGATNMINSLTANIPTAPSSPLSDSLASMPNPMASASDSLQASKDDLMNKATDLKSKAVDSMSPSTLSSQFGDSSESESDSTGASEAGPKAHGEEGAEPHASAGKSEPFIVNGGTYPNFLPNLGQGGAMMIAPVPPIPFQCTGSAKAMNLNICVLGDEGTWVSPPIPYMPPPSPPNVPIPGTVIIKDVKMPGDSPADKIQCDNKKVLCMSEEQGEATAQVASPAMYQPPPTPAGPPPPFPDSSPSYPVKYMLVQTINPGTDESTPLSSLSESGKEAAGIDAITGDASGFMKNMSSKIPPIPPVPALPDFPYALPQFPNVPGLPVLPQIPQMSIPQSPALNMPNTELINMGSFGLPTDGMSALLAQSGSQDQSVPPLSLGLSDFSAMEPQVIIIYIDPSELYQKGMDFSQQNEQNLLSQIPAQSPFDSSQYLSQFQDRLNAGQLAALGTLPYGQAVSPEDLYQQMAQNYPNFQDSQALQNLTSQYSALSQMMPQGAGALNPSAAFSQMAPTLSPVSMDMLSSSFASMGQNLQLQTGSTNNILGASNFFQDINASQAS